MKNKETLEEAAKNNLTYWKGFSGIGLPNAINSDRINKSFIAGAKWQQEKSYSEEEVFSILDEVFHMYASFYRKEAKEWFKQFKK